MMSDEPSPVALAPLERASESVLQQQTELFAQQEVLAATLNAMVLPVLVVNNHRQIISPIRRWQIWSMPKMGLHWSGSGPAKRCIVTTSTPVKQDVASPFCRYCGAARAMAEVELGAEREEEAFILRDLGQFPAALDLHIVAKSFQLGQERFTMMTIRDISGEKSVALRWSASSSTMCSTQFRRCESLLTCSMKKMLRMTMLRKVIQSR